MMKKSKVFIYSTSPNSVFILETPTPVAGKAAYSYIKEHVPSANIGVIGARDIQTLCRTHREMKPTSIVKDVKKFVRLASAETSAAKEIVFSY